MKPDGIAGRIRRVALAALCFPAALTLSVALSGCSEVSNNPHPLGSERTNTIYAPFRDRSPKYLDPTSSYSNDETPVTYQVYEPLYGYHYLKRPYELVGRTAQEIARPRYLDKDGKELPDDAPGELIDETVLDIKIKPGIMYAPHPAFAKDAQGAYVYHDMKREDVADKYKITDFKQTGTRELTADDYVYGIRRLATPRIKSPSFSTMSDYVVGLKEYGDKIVEADKALRRGLAPTDRDLPMLDFRKYPFAGAEALDKHTLRVRVKGKYPQFKYWLAMTFFSPIPWEAEKFYSQPGMAAKNLTMNYWPVGTGPYMLTDFVENRRHVLERNPNFHGETYPCEGERGDKEKGYLADCGKPLPFVDKVVFDMEKENVPLQAKFLQGYYDTPAIERLDYGTTYLVAMGDDAKKDKEYREKGIKLPTTVEANNWYIGFNWLDPVIGKGATPEQAERNRKLRQALSIAIDWEEHIAIFERGQGVAAQGPLPPSLFGYREDGPSAFNPVVYRKGSDGQPVRRSLDEAKKLLAEAGYPNGRDAATGKPLVLNFDYQQSRPSLEGAARLVREAVRQDRRAARSARDRLQPLPGQDEQGFGPDLLLGLARRLSGRREFPVHALRSQCQGSDQRQRREQRELPEPGVRQAVREDEIPGRWPGEAEAHRPDDRDRAERRGLELRLLSQVRGCVSPVDLQRQADADHPQSHRLPAPRSRAADARARRMEPAGVVADSADPDRVDRGHRAGVVCLAPA